MDTSLLEKVGVPTLDELRENFQKNDFTSTAARVNKKTASPDELRLYNQIDQAFTDAWNNALNSNVNWKNYSEDHPILHLKNADLEVIADAILKIDSHENIRENVMGVDFAVIRKRVENRIMEEYTLERLLTDNFKQDEIDKIVDAVASEFLLKMVELLQQVQSVQEIMEILGDCKAFEDYRHDRYNTDLIDFQRSWYHTRTNVGGMISLDSALENICADTKASKQLERVINDVSYEQLRDAFATTLDDVDKQILYLCDEDYTQSEIAKILGFASQGAISKRINKLEVKFLAFLKDYQ